MSDPTFSVVSTAKNEKDKKFLDKTFENWEPTKQLFEEKLGKRIEFIVVDAGGNAEFPKIEGKIIDPEAYDEYRKALYKSKVIEYSWWDSPSIGRNLGFKHAKGKIVVFQDIDSLFSTGTERDYRYVLKLDVYRNYFEVMYDAFKRKNIVGAAPSIRPMDSKSLGRRFGTMGLNYTVWLSTKLPTVKIKDMPIIGPSVAGCSFAVLRDVASDLWNDGLYDPRLAIAEDHKFSREVGRYGKISYEKRAGVFIRTSRVSSRFDILKSLGYAFKWAPRYLFPDFWQYQKHDLSI